MAAALNGRPRKTLGWKTPAEALDACCGQFRLVLRRPLESAQYVSHSIHRAPARGRDRAIGRQRRGLLRQRPRRDRHRPVQGRGDPALGPWRSFEAVEFATLEWVDWFNNRRLLEPIGNIPPAEAEARYYAHDKATALAA